MNKSLDIPAHALDENQACAAGAIRNAMTVDVEDYFQVSAFAGQIEPSSWSGFSPRVEQNTAKLLELFAQHNVLATFFVLGWVAERCPRLVRIIAEAGHEIACHGYSHQLVYAQTPQVFRAETIRAKACIEDQAQRPVRGYRAASFSIVKRSLWALDILAETGFTYDSSIFPVLHDRYGIHDSPRWPYRIETRNGASIVEFPATTANVLRHRFAIGGGGYLRIYPYWLTRVALAHINRVEQRPFVCYVHPWEVDPEQPRIRAGVLSRLRHYTNLTRCEKRLRQLIGAFRFAPMQALLEQMTVDEARPVSALSAA